MMKIDFTLYPILFFTTMWFFITIFLLMNYLRTKSKDSLENIAVDLFTGMGIVLGSLVSLSFSDQIVLIYMCALFINSVSIISSVIIVITFWKNEKKLK